ncbi:Kazal-type serine protease inhibitor domain-containing protein [Toxoplasma gondii VAND]|uniref:Kazal-type serine protease inhibitor domain-containing protein n=2 Tax=Toxoplasma gondii TaxID=5811 RepID=A0A086J7M9_TOXGO|nr:Kazal-type serine protease inhibitor domain-containing protein [Toxoplasma gondii p89]KFH01837.1 Kazal-type serine protease inhibitor domain-containing protein [Toxoplasma gondii VAND]
MGRVSKLGFVVATGAMYLAVCKAQPDETKPVCTCPKILAPVCGVNGKTYGNQCLLECDQVNLLKEGPCSPAPPGGDEEEIPVVCPLNELPVCGSDGVTYGNDCFRKAARVKWAHDGACEDH